MQGPLSVHPTNPRYFTDRSGRAIYLTGSHTWQNFQDITLDGAPTFDYTAHLDFLARHHHNYTRLWMWEQALHAPWTTEPLRFTPLPYRRSGPGLANDGAPKFDLTAWNEPFFERLRARVREAMRRGIYVSVMLFQGWTLNLTGVEGGDPWPYHPFNAQNNINGVDVAAGGRIDDDTAATLHSLGNPAVLDLQEAFARKVIDTVNDLDNVLYEIINEGGAVEWQYHLIEVIHAYERGKPQQHPVGMTFRPVPPMRNADLRAGPADWISPAPQPLDTRLPCSSPLEDYQSDPPAADGRKIILADTDHLWGHGGSYRWVWKSFLRGLHPIFMDPCDRLPGAHVVDKTPWMYIEGGICKDEPDYPDWEPARQAMGDTLRYAKRVNLAKMTPCPALASSRYCLADPGNEYLVYAPEGNRLTVDLTAAAAEFSMEWFIPLLNRTIQTSAAAPGGDYRIFDPPFTGDAVLYLKRR